VDAILAAGKRHHFLSVHKSGHVAIVETKGNDDCHVILRGGVHPNYDAASVSAVCATLAASGLPQRVLIDCSHANSRKDYQRQTEVANDIGRQIAGGERRIVGLMVESHLKAGRQDLVAGQPLEYGKSITDPCLGWEESLPVLERLAESVRKRRAVGTKRSA